VSVHRVVHNSEPEPNHGIQLTHCFRRGRQPEICSVYNGVVTRVVHVIEYVLPFNPKLEAPSSVTELKGPPEGGIEREKTGTRNRVSTCVSVLARSGYRESTQIEEAIRPGNILAGRIGAAAAHIAGPCDIRLIAEDTGG
jgi:hypothetical protein